VAYSFAAAVAAAPRSGHESFCGSNSPAARSRAAHVEAAAEAAEILTRSQIAAAERLGVCTRRGHWWLPR
jgi:hypothetical protein